MSLPSTKVFIVAFVCILGIGGLFYYSFQQHQTITEPQAAAAQISTTARAIAELDSDHDGLKDWEESLWGTDYLNPDSDGDGTPDGEEVNLRRNPALAGADALEPTGTPPTPNYFKTSTSTTDAAARQLFADYLALKQSGSFTPVTMQHLVNDLVGTIENGSQTADAFARSDLSIVADSQESVKVFRGAFESIIQRFAENSNEYDVIAEAIQNELRTINKLDPLIASNEKALAEFASLETPLALTSSHLKFLNSFSAYIASLRDIRNITADPIRSLVGGTQITVRDQAMQDAYRDMLAVFDKWGA